MRKPMTTISRKLCSSPTGSASRSTPTPSRRKRTHPAEPCRAPWCRAPTCRWASIAIWRTYSTSPAPPAWRRQCHLNSTCGSCRPPSRNRKIKPARGPKSRRTLRKGMNGVAESIANPSHVLPGQIQRTLQVDREWRKRIGHAVTRASSLRLSGPAKRREGAQWREKGARVYPRVSQRRNQRLLGDPQTAVQHDGAHPVGVVQARHIRIERALVPPVEHLAIPSE